MVEVGAVWYFLDIYAPFGRFGFRADRDTLLEDAGRPFLFHLKNLSIGI
jgi:hypothetical protein